MSLYIRDSTLQPFLKEDFLMAIFSSITYGIVVVLSGNCLHLLMTKRDIYPNRMRIILPIYIIIMLISSTWKEIGSIYILMNELASNFDVNVFLDLSFGLPITVIIWGADGFMVKILIIFKE
jgi:hypothetical protein